jgi:hypothetical protein
VNAGVRRIFARPPDFYRERFLPVASATGIAQSSSAIYYYLDIGLLIIMPITIGVGMNL